MSFLTEFWAFLKSRKKLWLVPVFLVMAVVAALVLLGSNPVVAPFIYTLF